MPGCLLGKEASLRHQEFAILCNKTSLSIYLGEFCMASPVLPMAFFAFSTFGFMQVQQRRGGSSDHRSSSLRAIKIIWSSLRSVRLPMEKHMWKKSIKNVKESPSHHRGCISSLSKFMIPICFVIESPKHILEQFLLPLSNLLEIRGSARIVFPVTGLTKKHSNFWSTRREKTCLNLKEHWRP